METTLFLAKVIGFFCIVMGASMLRRTMLLAIFRELLSQRALSYVMGVVMLILGLLITLVHSATGTLLQAFITVLGWGILVESAVFLFASEAMIKKYLKTLENKATYYAIAFGYLFLGTYLVYSGFF